MDDQLDEGLKNHIKKIFDEYDDPTADEGWVALRKKFPANEKRRGLALWPFMGAAALLLLALGFGLWKFNGSHTGNTVAGAKNPAKTTKDASQVAGNSQTHTATLPQLAQADKRTIGVTGAEMNPVSVKNAAGKNASLVSSNNVAKNTLLRIPPAVGPGQEIPRQPKVIKNDNDVIATQDSIKIAANKPVVNNSTTAGVSQASTATQAMNKPKTVTEMQAQNNPAPKKVEIKPDRVRFGVYAASYVNYAKGSANQANVGAGFTAEIRLAKNLKVVTGITLAGNSLNYTGGVPAGAVQTGLFTTPGVSGAANALYASSIKADAAITVASVPAFKNYGVNLLSVDVPLNLKYDFNIQRNNFYLMTGLSSGTFASESYTYNYNYPALPSPALQQDHAETSKKYFNNFYWGKMLNVAVGYGYPVGGNHLIIEPFVKYPLGGLGTQNIRFGAGGVNLKINFPTKIKN